MGILSIQSSVAAGHVGNAAAVFPLQRMGFDVWRVDTVVFSNHPAHGHHTGRIVGDGEIAALIDGLAHLDLWETCEGILSGYLGNAETGGVILDTVTQIRATRPEALYLCDPVFGDNGTVYVADAIVDFYRTAGIPAADIVTPNAFEAAHLTGVDTATEAGAVTAARALRDLGPRIAVVTGIRTGDTARTIALTPEGGWRVATPWIARESHGAGDLFTALLLGHLLRRTPLPEALSRAVSSVHAILEKGGDSGGRDIPLIAEQEALLMPPALFPADKIEPAHR
ncbi:MAG: pyridoxal kinase [Gammaproteobacteria bacterium]|jgi:pyridoxine kinase